MKEYPTSYLSDFTSDTNEFELSRVKEVKKGLLIGFTSYVSADTNVEKKFQIFCE